MEVNIVSNNFGKDGIGRYSRLLHQHLRKREDVTVKKVFFNFDQKEVLVNGEPVSSSWRVPLIDNHLLFGLQNKKILEQIGGDISHISTHTFSYLEADRRVVTCHDLKTLKQDRGPVVNAANRIKYSGIADAEHVVAISKYGKKQIQNRFEIPDEEITAIYQGIGKPFSPMNGDFRTLRKKHGIPERDYYVLHVSVERANKNIPTLIEAIAEVLEEKNVQLIRAGSRRYPEVSKRVDKEIAERGVQDHVSIIGHVPENDLVKLYNLADVFAFPSLLEGFGRPPLEAMACGIPTIVSNVTSLPEVVGPAGRIIDPTKPDELASEILDLLESDTARKALRKKGLERAEKFDWERTASKTVEVYEKILRT